MRPIRGAGERAVPPEVARDIRETSELMEQSILAGSTPPMALVNLRRGATMRLTRAGDHEQRIAVRWSVTGIPDGVLPVTALLPVSGHVGAEARRFADTNVYAVSVTDAGGVTTAFEVRSTGYVTAHTFDVKLKPGKNFVRFMPKGSGGVEILRSGREIELDWAGD